MDSFLISALNFSSSALVGSSPKINKNATSIKEDFSDNSSMV